MELYVKYLISASAGSSLRGLHMRDTPLSPPSTWAEILRHTCLEEED